MAERLFVVFNPRSGKGRGACLVAPVLEALRGADVEQALTAHHGDEERLVQEALGRGHRTIVAVGGDGTWSHVASAILRSGQAARLGLIPGGTGCDLAKSLGIPRDVAGAARVIVGGHQRAIDVGTIEDRFFLNVAGFGFDIAVIEDSLKVRWLQGNLLYLYCAMRQLYRYPGFSLEMAADGGAPTRQQTMMLIVANARVFGGGFQIAPEADLADGQLDAVTFADMPLARRFPLMIQLLKGAHARSPEVTFRRASSFRLRFAAPPPYETDGERNQARSSDLVIGTRPRALTVLVPAPA